MTADLPFSPAADRNKQAILDALRRALPASASVLEIASGTGQHAQHFALACPAWRWQPTDADPATLPAIDARCRGLANVWPAVQLDVLLHQPWPAEPARYSAVYCANLLHIAPWSACAALMTGAARHLCAVGQLVIYGPFRIDGVPSAASNEAFDADLKSRDPAWGLRWLGAVEREAAAQGLLLRDVIDLPANNLLVSFARKATGA
jgi:Protein of unknown function (DUF938)